MNLQSQVEDRPRLIALSILNGSRGKDYAYEMTWNDPDETISERNPNSRGARARIFGENAFDRFMKAIPASVMVRSHEYPRDGFEIMFHGRLATIFSNGSGKSQSSHYAYMVRQAVFLKTKLSQKKEGFEPSDFIEITYS